jgi:3-oxoacyl-[acyl-carrier protein] reductase
MSMTGELAGRIAIVTGGAQGFGAGIVDLFVRNGASVVIADINEGTGRREAERLTKAGAHVAFVKTDVSRSADVAALVKATLDRFGRLDILVNNAGTTHVRKPMLEVDEATFDRVWAVNVKSIYLGAVHAVPVFRRQGKGVILNIASTAGVRPRPGLTWYNGSKSAVIGLTRSMAIELAPDRIRVNAVNPVAGDTPLLAAFMGGDTPENRKKFIDTIPLGRLSTPTDIAEASLFLCSDRADMITGVCMEVDGGRCI